MAKTKRKPKVDAAANLHKPDVAEREIRLKNRLEKNERAKRAVRFIMNITANYSASLRVADRLCLSSRAE